MNEEQAITAIKKFVQCNKIQEVGMCLMECNKCQYSVSDSEIEDAAAAALDALKFKISQDKAK